MVHYLISDADKPWLTLFSSARLEAVAEAIAAQPQIMPSSIYASLDGKPRSLTDDERIELLELVLGLCPDDPAAAAALEAARHADD